jgi:hypothetical protein
MLYSKIYANIHIYCIILNIGYKVYMYASKKTYADCPRDTKVIVSFDKSREKSYLYEFSTITSDAFCLHLYLREIAITL